MKKIITIIILVLSTVISYGQSLVIPNEFECTNARAEDGIIKCFELRFKDGHCVVIKDWKEDKSGLVTEMTIPSNVKTSSSFLLAYYDFETRMKIIGVDRESREKNVVKYWVSFFEFDLGLNNMASSSNLGVAKYRTKDYTYILNTVNGDLRVVLNK